MSYVAGWCACITSPFPTTDRLQHFFHPLADAHTSVSIARGETHGGCVVCRCDAAQKNEEVFERRYRIDCD